MDGLNSDGLDALQTVAGIIDRAPTPQEVWYGHSILTSTLFPAVEPPAGTDYVSKRVGGVEYLLEAGIDPATHERRFPAGKYPRLIMAWMAKQIRMSAGRRTGTVDPERRMVVIPSMHRLASELGLSHGGATALLLQEQLRLLLASHISVRVVSEDGGVTYRDSVSLPLVEAVRLAEGSDDPSKGGAAFVLTKDVWVRLSRESAPFDTRAASFLLSGRSVLPYDVYVWLSGSMGGLRHPVRLDWDWLYARFGDGVSSMKNFRLKFRRAVGKVRVVYPGVRVEVGSDGVLLLPSPAAVPRRAQGGLPGVDDDAKWL
jgi:hypothetical protein